MAVNLPMSDPTLAGPLPQEAALQSAQAQLAGAQSGLVGQQAQSASIANQGAVYAQQQLRYQFARTMAFQKAFSDYSAHPTTQGYVQLAGDYPDKIAELRDVHAQQDEITRRQSLTTSSSMLARANAGDAAGAAAIYAPQRTADITAGRHDEDSEQIYQDLLSGDPQRINAAKAVLSVHAATAIPNEKDAPGMLEAMGMSQKPIILKQGETAINQVNSGRTVVPNALTSNVVADQSGNQRVVTTDPNPQGYGSTPGGISGAGQTGGVNQVSAGGPPVSAGAPGQAQPQVGTAALTGVVRNIESGKHGDFYPNGKPVTSSAGAKYAMQVLPKVAADPGFGIEPAANDTPEEYNRVGTQLLQAHLDHYGDPIKAAAAYHSGRGGVNNAVAKATAAGNPSQWASYLGPAGRKYVAMTGTALAKSGTQVADSGPLTASSPGVAMGQQNQVGGPVAAPQGAPSPGGDYMGPQPGANPVHDPGAGTVSPIPNTKGASPGSHWGNPSQDPSEVVGREYPNKGGPEDFASQDPTTKESMFRDYILENKSPPVNGTSGTGFKVGFDKEVGPWMAAHGVKPADLPAIRQQFAVDKFNYDRASATAAALKTASDSIKLDGQAVIKAHKDLVDRQILGNYPLQNEANLALWSHVGSQDTQGAIRAYEDALGAYKGKVARFLGTGDGTGGAGQTTEGASGRAAELNNPAMPHGVLVSHINQNSVEVDNARTPYVKQAAVLDQKMRGYLGGTGAVSQQAHSGGAASVPQVTNAEQYAAVASGQQYTDRHGNVRTKR